MASAPDMIPLELAPQRAMFALEFRDPIRDVLVAAKLRVAAEGLGRPIVTPSNRFAWLDRDPPADRRIEVEMESTDEMFVSERKVIDVPAHRGAVQAKDLIFPWQLRPTGLYEPPQGMVAVGGMLVESRESRAAVEGVGIRIHFHHAEGMTFTGPYRAVTDGKGRFIAVIGRQGDVRPDIDPYSPGTFKMAWLTLERGDEVRVSPLSLRSGRLLRIPAPLEWATLSHWEIEDEFVRE